jgi:TPR repeat protein
MKVDYEKAREYYGMAATNGSDRAMYNLGCMCDKGHGLAARDGKEATRWFTAAAMCGNARAQNALGINYELGDGVARNWATALFWYRKAAEQGLSDALFNLGLCCFYGRGLPRNVNEAYVSVHVRFLSLRDPI